MMPPTIKLELTPADLEDLLRLWSFVQDARRGQQGLTDVMAEFNEPSFMARLAETCSDRAVLRRMGEQGFTGEVAQRLVCNPSLEHELRRGMLQDAKLRVHWAEMWDCRQAEFAGDVKFFESLTRDPIADVRYSLAQNPGITDAMRHELTLDSDSGVVELVAQAKLSFDDAQRLAHHECRAVRSGLAEMTEHAEVLKILLRDEDAGIRRKAEQQLSRKGLSTEDEEEDESAAVSA